MAAFGGSEADWDLTLAQRLVDACLGWDAGDKPRRRTLLTVLNRATKPEHGVKARLAERLLSDVVHRYAVDLAPALVEVATDEPAGSLGAVIAAAVPGLDHPVLEALDAVLPRTSLTLSEAAYAIASRQVELARIDADAFGHLDTLEAIRAQSYLSGRLNNFGVRAAAVGRREEALAASQEAVDIRRALAKDRPDAFLPDLAMSLGAMSQTLAAAGRQGEAADCAREGLNALAPFVEAHPQAFGDLARALGRDHIEACKLAGREPDGALLERVTRALGRTAARDADEADDPVIAALKARIGAIIEEAQRAGTLNEGALAELPPEIAEQLRAAWAAQGDA